MAKEEIKKVNKTPNKKATDENIKKLKLLFTVVDRSKALYYVDLLEQYEVNMQTVVFGKGTVNQEIMGFIHINENEKAIIISVIRDDKVSEILETLNEKFNKVKNGKGIAFTVPVKSIIGVQVYQFLSNNKTFLKEVHNG